MKTWFCWKNNSSCSSLTTSLKLLSSKIGISNNMVLFVNVEVSCLDISWVIKSTVVVIPTGGAKLTGVVKSAGGERITSVSVCGLPNLQLQNQQNLTRKFHFFPKISSIGIFYVRHVNPAQRTTQQEFHQIKNTKIRIWCHRLEF